VTVEQPAGKGAYHGESWLPSAYDLFANPLGSQSTMTETGGENAVVRELPPAPGSATLFLLGLGSMGAWQLARSSRKLHGVMAPDWYHTGGPDQAGSAVPIDLDFGPGGLLPSLFDRPSDAGVPRRPPAQLGRELVCDEQLSLRAADPRGPPVPLREA
jgi:hypothetical protein